MFVTLRMGRPQLVCMSELFTPQQCVATMEAALPRLARSTVVSRATGAHEVDGRRTSLGTHVSHAELPFLSGIDDVLFKQFGLDPVNAEQLSVSRYEVGQEFQPHFDYFDPADPGSQVALAHGGQRIATLLIYLNRPLSGGETTFPDAGIEVVPSMGSAALFRYPTPTKDTLTLHGGKPVAAGEKWIATRWYRAGPFR